MRKRSVSVLLFILMFGVSSESQAFLEWLHKLSGPGPFIGVRLACRVPFTRDEGKSFRLTECGGGVGLRKQQSKWTGSLALAGAVSYQNDLDYGAQVDAPRVWMWGIEPTVERWWTLTDRVELLGGVGYLFNEFQGRGFEDFRRDAVVPRLGLRINRENKRIHAVEFGLKYLYFEDRFKPEDFGALSDQSEERGVIGAFFKAYFWRVSEAEKVQPAED